MKGVRRLLAILALALPAGYGFAGEPFLFRSLEVEDGLSQNTVYCILQDSREFMWFGTQDGLNRYDGSSFKVFKSSTSPNFDNDGVICLAEGKDDDLWVGTISGLYLYRQESEVFSEVPLYDPEGKKIEGLVRSMVFDANGNLFVAAAGNCLIKFTPEGEQSAMDLGGSDAETQIRSLCADQDGNIWAATYGPGLIRVNGGTGEARVFPTPWRTEGTGDLLTKVTVLDSKTLLLGTISMGVLTFNIKSQVFEPFEGLDGTTARFVHNILVDRNGCIWVGAENGLHIYDHGRVTNLEHIPNDPYSLSDNAIYSITQDRDGGVWIGSYFGGVNYYSSYSSQFDKFYPEPGQNDLKGKNISEFCEDGDGIIWVGTEDAGLYRFNPADRSFQSASIPAGNIHALAMLDGKLWAGTYGDGLFILDTRTGGYNHFNLSPLGVAPRNNSIYAICRDDAGRTWLGTEEGLYRETDGGFTKQVPDLITSQVNDIACDFNGNMWISTMNQGVFRMDASSEEWSNPEIGCAYVTCIMEDRVHNLWFGTKSNGIIYYNHLKQSFENIFNTSNGLPDDMVYKLLEDGSGAIWGSTNHGLFRISEARDNVVCFDHSSGLVCDQFNFNSGERTSDGQFYFGGVKGFIRFDPLGFEWPAIRSKIVFTRFLIFNKEASVGEKDSPLEKSITRTTHITLNHDQSVFSIGFADLNFASSDKKGYQYQLVGHHQNWIDIADSKLITFSNLPAGNYRLDVRANPLNASEEEPVNSLFLTVLPPWYKTTLAFVLYALLAIAAVIGAILLARWKYDREKDKVFTDLERQKEKELYDAKIGFFTHITHEIRTPLTLITVPIEEIMKQTDKGSPTYEGLSIIQRNSNRLLTLVNQLLDFKKAGVNDVQLNFIHFDIVPLIKETAGRFNQLAQTSGITITENLPDTLFADADREILTKILSNILNNACKHAASVIRISASAGEDRFRIEVSNDGDRIPADQAERIFDPFVKLDDETPGSGIGLPFSRSLAKTHDGSIFVDLAKEDTTFVLDLPKVQKTTFTLPGPDVVEEQQTEVEEPAEEQVAVASGKRVLIVDDNEDFLALLKHSLASQYEVVTAAGGKEAMDILSHESIDLVVTDLMMPGVDGKALCSHIKDNFATSHIPVILLTARSDLQTRMECLKLGVDEYITKPFSADYLKVRMENLLSSRETLRNAFQHSPEVGLEALSPSKADSVFLEKVNAIINEKMENPNLDVEELAEAMNMSRATLYRKMKSVTDMSPNDFIRLCRLKKAALLLSAKEYQVNEIAYIVGFSSVSYFSKCFSKQFGVSPKDFAK